MERGGGAPALQQKGPRANRSKKTLPAAFCSREPGRLLSPPPPHSGGAADGAVEATRSEPARRLHADHVWPLTAAGATVAPHVLSDAAALTGEAGGGGGGSGSGGVGGSSSSSPGGPPALPPPQLLPPLMLGWAAGSGSGNGGERREGIRLDSLVFLSSCPQRHGHFATKKMLHPPTLGLFCLVELPGTEHQRVLLRTSLQDWLGRWCALQAEHPDLLVEVCEAYWDSPLGYPMGILCEYMPLGSLDELIQACGGLPEEAMREIAQCVLECLDTLHSASPPVVHGYLKPSQVLFSFEGRPKLTFGLEQRLKGCQVWSLPSPHGDGGEGMTPDGGPPAARSGNLSSGEQSSVVDIFDLGLLLLVSALGGLDILLDAIPYAREFGSQRSSRGPSAPLNALSVDTCALLQHELRGAFRGEEGSGGSDMGYLPPASDLLFNRRYSAPFLAFVSTCLEAHTQSTPVSARELLEHQFLHEQATVGPLVSLQEMQGLARLLNEAPSEHDPSRFGPAKSARSLVPGVAPSVAQSAHLYLMSVAQSIAEHCGPGFAGVRGGAVWRPETSTEHEEASAAAAPGQQQQQPPLWRQQEWETLLTDTARTLGLQRSLVQDALQAQIERLLTNATARDRRRTASEM